MSNYAFEGQIIKLNNRDYHNWKSIYPSLDLTQELIQLDMELVCQQADGKDVRKWYSQIFARLNGRNKRAQRFGAQSNGRQSLADRMHAATSQIYADATARENGGGYVAADDPVVRPQVGFSRGDAKN